MKIHLSIDDSFSPAVLLCNYCNVLDAMLTFLNLSGISRRYEMSIAFGGTMKDMDDDALRQALRAVRKTASKRKRIKAIRRISRRHWSIWRYRLTSPE